MDPQNIKLFYFMEDLFVASLSINFGISYKPSRKRANSPRKHISPNAVAAINDVVRCFLNKYNEHIADIIVTLRRRGNRDVYIALLGQFYLLESGFSWSKVRKFVGLVCSVATYCYVNGTIYLSDQLLNHCVSFLGCKLFGNPEKFIGWEAFEQYCAYYVSKNKHTRILGDMKRLEDLQQELQNMLSEFKRYTENSGIIHPQLSHVASSLQSSHDPDESYIEVHSCVRFKHGNSHGSNTAAALMVGNVDSEGSTSNRYEPVAGPSSAQDDYIPQHLINNPASSGTADHMSYNQALPFLTNMQFDGEEAVTEQFVSTEVSELEYLLRLSLKTIDIIKNTKETYHIRFN